MGKEAKAYVSKNIFPMLTFITYLALALYSSFSMLYVNFFFFAVLIAYFAYRGEYSFRALFDVKSGAFWKNVGISLLFIVGAFLLMTGVQSLFPQLELGEIKIPAHTPFEMVLFAVQTIIFPPLAEEMFYRKYLISFRGRGIMWMSALFSSILFAATHALSPFGIATYTILGMGFACAYIMHKNIGANIMAHFLTNLIANGTAIALYFLH
ncbi:MAG: CPBP family intramembrane metalloprotease [Actinomycetaceae bacterium]|nr:CPBP family intramembrane metalloprotease [Actinomycetaceae bacterium]